MISSCSKLEISYFVYLHKIWIGFVVFFWSAFCICTFLLLTIYNYNWYHRQAQKYMNITQSSSFFFVLHFPSYINSFMIPIFMIVSLQINQIWNCKSSVFLCENLAHLLFVIFLTRNIRIIMWGNQRFLNRYIFFNFNISNSKPLKRSNKSKTSRALQAMWKNNSSVRIFSILCQRWFRKIRSVNANRP